MAKRFIFSVDLESKLILDPDVITLVPALKKLTQEQLLYVILLEDYSSPYWQYPVQERERFAKAQAFGKKDVKLENNQFIQDAIIQYRSLQYEPKRETRKAYINKIHMLELLLEQENDPVKIREIQKAIDSLNNSLEHLESQINSYIDIRQMEGKNKLSYLEVYKENILNHQKALKTSENLKKT